MVLDRRLALVFSEEVVVDDVEEIDFLFDLWLWLLLSGNVRLDVGKVDYVGVVRWLFRLRPGILSDFVLCDVWLDLFLVVLLGLPLAFLNNIELIRPDGASGCSAACLSLCWP